jgi:hypothetical protein
VKLTALDSYVFINGKVAAAAVKKARILFLIRKILSDYILLPQLTLEFSILLGEQNSASEILTIRQYSFGFLPCLLLPKLHIILQELVGGAIYKFFHTIKVYH